MDKKFIVPVVLSIIAVVFSLLSFFHEGTESDEPDDSDFGHQAVLARGDSDSSGLRIAYVNTDLLLEKYELVTELADRFEREQNKRESDLDKRTKEYQQEAQYFQESVANNSLSEQSAQQIYEKLMQKQQDLYALQEQYSQELARHEMEMNKVLLDSVKNFLGRLNTKAQYDYILNYTIAGPVLLANDSYDITPQVLEGLNNEYRIKNGLEEEGDE
ncbi:MAG: OmpH family outer membrane protein [Bacteroidales bacterium]